jgi:hypothetical protein
LHISNRGAGSAAVLNVGVDPAKTLGDIGIEVVDHRAPRFASGREERIATTQPAAPAPTTT